MIDKTVLGEEALRAGVVPSGEVNLSKKESIVWVV
jgi:hypothetical protein